ncbi:hypothetical protein Drose_05885 [Dactylosporangium roseum]|uniref:Uncharacterized protein n=1 Tax=Dactylosporangium roseum TaxID=47989 RepID=A0ABY5Z8B8_9ACTN|nr:hypothetical protein [Dactylosporangium roseum]UWZ37801.1 hypothetical protein Drose_05885 [Dactylosporangium roseum]
MAEGLHAALWEALPKRMPGMVPGVVALRVPGVPLPVVVAALEEMVGDGRVIRVVRRKHDVYYRGPWSRPDTAAPAANYAEETPLWT